MKDPLESNSRFQVVRRLAVGGMGEVLLARFAGDGELEPGLVVIKRTLPDHPNRAHQNTMLREEARVALRLRHENLVETFGLDEVDEDPLVVMEYLAGRSMAQILGAAKRNKAPLPLGAAVKVLRAAACGLHFAHTLRDRGRPLGLVHRDVSPANLFVTFDGRAKVIDFGVAKADDSEIKTSTGILKGKIGYMSPEHARGDKLDPRSDLWSLGVVLWEMLVADRLFAGPNPAVTLHQIAQLEIPSPRARRPEVPRPLEELCMCLLMRDKQHRVQSGAELVSLVDQLPPLGGGDDLGALLAERFPEEAEQGAREAREAARPRRRPPIPMGLVDGGTPIGVDEPDDAVPTRVMDSAELFALTHGDEATVQHATVQHPTVEEDLAEAPTAILSSSSDSGELVAVDVAPRETGADPAVSAVRPRALVDEPPTRAERPRGPPASSISSPWPAAPAGPPASSSSAPRPAPARAGPSALTVALITFGLIAVVMGAVFALLSARRAPRPTYLAAQVDGTLLVVARHDDLPPGAPAAQAGQLNPDAPPPGLGLSAAELHAKLRASGVEARARLPKSPRAKVAAGLPAAITALGLLALALALPGLLPRPGLAWALRALLVAAVAAGGAFFTRAGALGWPGLAALEEPDIPPRLELPIRRPSPADRKAP